MIEATLVGGLAGGLFRLAPEILKVFDRKGERKHELAMQNAALEFEKLRGAQRMNELTIGATTAYDTAALSALQEALQGQGERSGVRWADALTITVRPVVTYWFMALYFVQKLLLMTLAWQSDTAVAAIATTIWTAEDAALFAGLLNFWFLGRVFDKRYGS